MSILFVIRVFLSASDKLKISNQSIKLEYYSPLFIENQCAALIPTPEEYIDGNIPSHLDPCRSIEPCSDLPFSMFQPKEFR